MDNYAEPTPESPVSMLDEIFVRLHALLRRQACSKEVLIPVKYCVPLPPAGGSAFEDDQ